MPDSDDVRRVSRRLAATIEPVVGSVYFAPECHEAYEALGFGPSPATTGKVALPDGAAYFTSRGSCMGQVPGELVAAAFGVFNPAVVVPAVGYGWTLTDAPTIAAARAHGATAQLVRILGEPDGIGRVTELLQRATEPLVPAGKPLYSGLLSLGLPGNPMGDLWRLGDLLREYRGDAHIGAWTAAGLDAVEIGLLTELFLGMPLKTYIRSRAWSAEQLDEGIERLKTRGLIDAEGAFTPAGRDFREEVEDTTDRQMTATVAALGDDADELFAVVGPWGDAIRAAGGYLAHVGIGLMLVGFLSSTAYDDSTKVTLEQGKAQQVGDLSLTFIRFLPRSEGEKERMEVEVVQADGSRYFAYPKFFLNDRTRQLMVNPDIRKTLLRDVYISPLEFQPGVEAGAARTVELAPGEGQEIGGLELRFLGFAVSAEGGNAMAAMAAGQPVTVGARLAMTTGSETTELVPLYRFNPAGFVETPPLDLPGGGSVMVQAINASSGAVQLNLRGLGGAAGVPARLSLDVTTKPLIKLVWYGLYVVLIGGMIATVARVRQARRIIEESR